MNTLVSRVPSGVSVTRAASRWDQGIGLPNHTRPVKTGPRAQRDPDNVAEDALVPVSPPDGGAERAASRAEARRKQLSPLQPPARLFERSVISAQAV
jgi:hypothetical protein